MRKGRVLIIQRSDLIERRRLIDISLLDMCDFGFREYRLMLNSDLVMFVDDDGSYKILRNRYSPNHNYLCELAVLHLN